MENKVIVSYELLLPAMGEGIIEATITRWMVSAGQQVTKDQPLVEVATDKVDSEIPSPVNGTIVRLVYREGEIPRVGEVIALIETADAPGGKYERKRVSEMLVSAIEGGNNAIPESRPLKTERTKNETGGEMPFVTPLVRMLARQRGLSAADLKIIEGTGNNGLITRDDLNRYIMKGRSNHNNNAHVIRPAHAADQATREIKPGSDDEVFEMDRMRKLIASHMIASKTIAAHVTSFLEADITPLVLWRENNKEVFYARENARLTYTPVFIQAVAKALQEFPRINVTVSGDSIIMHKNINVGVATALSDGNLIVPVIKNANHDNIGGLARRLTDLASRARSGTLIPEEIRGGTFTITNIGQYNNLTGTPIINQPESAILAFGTILKKPWAVKTPEGYGVAVRDIIMLALSYDHRIIDGALGGSFLSAVAKYLEAFGTDGGPHEA